MNWLSPHPHHNSFDWTIRQLNLQPHQHLLEVGCGSGRLLTAVAGKTQYAFIAAIEPSITLYRRACRRNKRLIQQETAQLHHGQLQDLPYPAAYFHTIYGSASDYPWTNLASECLRLSILLRPHGRLILLSRPGHYRNEADLRIDSARWQAACRKAGLTDIHTEYRRFPPGICAAVTGFKPEIHPDYEPFTTVNKRLLNPQAYFISNVARMQI